MRFSLRTWTLPIALLIITILSFGLLLPSLGFYWDDWPSVLIARLQGLHGFEDFFSLDRPTTYISYFLFVPIFGTDPIRWQIFALALRWIAAVLVWQFVHRLWPESGDLPAWAAFLFAVYPVFHQQPIAMTYHQLWIEYVFYLLSLTAMVRAVRQPKWYIPWTILAVACLAGNFLISEYFLGVDLLRVFILWLLIRDMQKNTAVLQTVKSALLHWLPYLATLIIYLAWRFVFLKLPGDDRNAPVLLTSLLQQPGAALRDLLQMALQDVTHIVISNWYATLQPALFDLSSRFNLLVIGLGIIAAGVTGLYLSRLHTGTAAQPQGGSLYPRLGVLLGALLVIAAPLPAWVTNRQITVGAYSDRLAVPAMLGASLLLASLAAWFIRSRPQQILVISLLVGLAIGSNTRIANDFRWARIQQNRFFWQLYWRAPSLMPGTAVLAYAEVLPKTGLYSTASGINLVYASPGQGNNLPYWFFSISRQLGYRMPEFLSGMVLENTFRQFTYQGSSANSLIVYYDPGNSDCLRIPTPQDASDPDLQPLVVQALSMTNLSRIQPGPQPVAAPRADIFGPEPEHSWCYYFEKADLARQSEDWQQVVAIGDQARALGYQPSNGQSNTPQEWVPFIQGYAAVGRWQEARDLTQAIVDLQPKILPHVCAAWKSIRAQPGSDGEAGKTLQAMGCPDQ